MVGSGVWGEYFFFPTLLERDFGKGGCGNVVSSVDLWRWLATMGEIESRIVDPCRCQDLRCQNKGCSTAAAPAQDRHLAGSGIGSSVIP